MTLLSASRLLVAAGAVAASTSGARAALYGWNYTKGQAGEGTQYSRDDGGGTVESISTSFDSTTRRLSFDVVLSGPTGPGSPLATNGFWLVLDNGPNPKTHSGELSILYFDASRVFAGLSSTPVITAYGYNGQDANSSWRDGDGDGTNDSSDLIAGAYETGFINSAAAGTTTISGQTYRELSFDIDATGIIGHTPAFPVAGTDWQGIGFESLLGIWFHPVQNFSAIYEPSGSGRRGGLMALGAMTDGYLDGSNFLTNVIPAPLGAPLLGMGVMFASGRRRRP